jgi:DNA-binding response OmpR family regulator
MDGTHRLSGLSVLILEDEYYLAEDAKQALEDAGAEVVGPCSDAAEAVALVDQNKPDCALVDVNLGRGANFAPAQALLARGVPIIFMTGYDSNVIPPAFSHLPCLQKPTQGDRIVAAVGQVCAR